MRRLIGLVTIGLALIVLTGLAEARDPAQVRAFRATHPCPATNKTVGACPGWVVDHQYPLCAGGADDPTNMEWQPVEAAKAKDRIEVELCRCKEGK